MSCLTPRLQRSLSDCGAQWRGEFITDRQRLHTGWFLDQSDAYDRLVACVTGVSPWAEHVDRLTNALTALQGYLPQDMPEWSQLVDAIAAGGPKSDVHAAASVLFDVFRGTVEHLDAACVVDRELRADPSARALWAEPRRGVVVTFEVQLHLVTQQTLFAGLALGVIRPQPRKSGNSPPPIAIDAPPDSSGLGTDWLAANAERLVSSAEDRAIFGWVNDPFSGPAPGRMEYDGRAGTYVRLILAANDILRERVDTHCVPPRDVAHVVAGLMYRHFR